MIASALALPALLVALAQVPHATTATAAGDSDAFDALMGQPPIEDDAFGRPALFIEAIELVGNDKTSDSVILRRILLEVGDLIDDQKVEESRLRLLSTGFFKSVEFSLRRGSKRGRVLLIVEVVERNTILIDELYLGFSSVAPIFGGFGVVENNFLGRGVTTGASFVVGRDRRALLVRFFVPDLSNTPLQLSGSAILLQGAELLDQENPDGEQIHYRRYGGTLGVGIGVAPAQRVSLIYRLESVHTDRLPNLDPAILRGAPSIQFDDSVLSTLSLTYERDTRDDAFVPTQGDRVSLGVELGTSLIGSSYEFSKYTAEYQHAFLLFGSHSLLVSAFGGLIQGHAPFFNQFFISDYAYFAFGRDSLPRNAELNFSESNDYDDLIINANVTYNVPLQSGGSLLLRTFFYGGLGVTATASLDELQEDPSGRGTGGKVPILVRRRHQARHVRGQLHALGRLHRRSGAVTMGSPATSVLPWFLLAALAGQPREEPAPLSVTLARGSRIVTASFDVTSAFTEQFRKRLNGGILSTVEIEMKLLDTDNAEVAATSRRCDLRLDIWDDVLLVRIQDPERTQRKRFIAVDEGLKACGDVDRAVIADGTLLTRPAGYRLYVAVSLNPVSEDLLERSREFSSNPRGGGAGRPPSLLGGVAKLFHGDSTAGGQTFYFQSQMLVRPGG